VEAAAWRGPQEERGPQFTMAYRLSIAEIPATTLPRPVAANPREPPPLTLSRLAVRRPDPRWKPGALAAHAGICAGGGKQSPSLPRQSFFQGFIKHMEFGGSCLENLGPAVAVCARLKGRRAGVRRYKAVVDPNLKQRGNTNLLSRHTVSRISVLAFARPRGALRPVLA
jgi:hypothetical protein